jgi:hypothetical protein
MALTVGRAGEDSAQKCDMVAARDPFQIFPVQRTSAHSIEHPIIVFARHKLLLLDAGPSSNLGEKTALKNGLAAIGPACHLDC